MGNRAINVIQAREAHRKSMERLAHDSGATGRIAEALGNAVADLLRMEDEGWTLINKLDYANGKGMSLDEAKETTKYLEQQTKTSGGLLGRGLRLKNNHCFGRGFKLVRADGSKLQERFNKIVNDPINWQAVFSPTALKDLNRILYTSGNLFLVYDEEEREFTRLAIDLGVENAISHPEDPSRINFILRSYNVRDDLGGTVTTIKEWIPTLSYRDSRKSKVRKGEKVLPTTLPIPGSGGETANVAQKKVIIERRINKDNGDVWGIPDAFSAAPWAILYTAYLRDGAKLQNALAAISFLVRVKTEAAAKSAGSMLSGGKIGGAAITGPDTTMETLPRSGAVDLYEGRPIQAQVASNLDVSTTGIAADPGLGGSYASESALSQPEQLAALSRQEDFTDLFRQIFQAMGADDARIDFARLDTDPIHRTVQGLTLARLNGGINQEEYRLRVLELFDIDRTGKQLPEPDEWTGSKASTLMAAVLDAALMDDPDADNSGNGSVPGQGQSGDVGSLDDDGNDARNSDRDAGEA